MSIGSESLSSQPISGAGSGVYISDVIVRPDGWAAATFGQAKIALTQKGWIISTFTQPLAIHNTINTVAGWPSTAFGSPSTIAAATFMVASFGKIAFFGTPVETNHVTCSSEGWRYSTFGTPHIHGVFRASPTGVVAVGFGTAKSAIRSKPVGWKAPSFGQAWVSRTQMAHGFVATRMGCPQMNRTTPYNPILSLPTLHVRTRNAEIFVLT